MRNTPINKAMGFLAPSLLATGLFVSSATTAMPLQNTVPTASKSGQEVSVPSKTAAGSLAKNPALARNTTAKPEPVVVATSATPKTQDKKTISRCWKRLMNMVREINHAHTSKTK
ncbi:hypothetical protein [Spirosoma jeollabukense]